MKKHNNTTKALTHTGPHTAWNTAHTVNVHTTVALPQRQTKTEIDDVGRRTRRRAKTETYALWGKATRQLPFSWRGNPRVTKTELSISHLPCDSLTSVSAAPCPEEPPQSIFFFFIFFIFYFLLNLLSEKRISKESRQPPWIVPAGLTED